MPPKTQSLKERIAEQRAAMSRRKAQGLDQGDQDIIVAAPPRNNQVPAPSPVKTVSNPFGSPSTRGGRGANVRLNMDAVGSEMSPEIRPGDGGPPGNVLSPPSGPKRAQGPGRRGMDDEPLPQPPSSGSSALAEQRRLHKARNNPFSKSDPFSGAEVRTPALHGGGGGPAGTPAQVEGDDEIRGTARGGGAGRGTNAYSDSWNSGPTAAAGRRHSRRNDDFEEQERLAGGRPGAPASGPAAPARRPPGGNPFATTNRIPLDEQPVGGAGARTGAGYAAPRAPGAPPPKKTPSKMSVVEKRRWLQQQEQERQQQEQADRGGRGGPPPRGPASTRGGYWNDTNNIRNDNWLDDPYGRGGNNNNTNRYRDDGPPYGNNNRNVGAYNNNNNSRYNNQPYNQYNNQPQSGSGRELPAYFYEDMEEERRAREQRDAQQWERYNNQPAIASTVASFIGGVVGSFISGGRRSGRRDDHDGVDGGGKERRALSPLRRNNNHAGGDSGRRRSTSRRRGGGTTPKRQRLPNGQFAPSSSPTRGRSHGGLNDSLLSNGSDSSVYAGRRSVTADFLNENRDTPSPSSRWANKKNRQHEREDEGRRPDATFGAALRGLRFVPFVAISLMTTLCFLTCMMFAYPMFVHYRHPHEELMREVPWVLNMAHKFGNRVTTPACARCAYKQALNMTLTELDTKALTMVAKAAAVQEQRSEEDFRAPIAGTELAANYIRHTFTFQELESLAKAHHLARHRARLYGRSRDSSWEDAMWFPLRDASHYGLARFGIFTFIKQLLTFDWMTIWNEHVWETMVCLRQDEKLPCPTYEHMFQNELKRQGLTDSTSSFFASLFGSGSASRSDRGEANPDDMQEVLLRDVMLEVIASSWRTNEAYNALCDQCAVDYGGVGVDAFSDAAALDMERKNEAEVAAYAERQKVRDAERAQYDEIDYLPLK